MTCLRHLEAAKLRCSRTRPVPAPARVELQSPDPSSKQQKGGPALSARSPRTRLAQIALSARAAKPSAVGHAAAEARVGSLQPSRLKILPRAAPPREAKPGKAAGVLGAAKQGGTAKPTKMALPKLSALPRGAPVRRRVDAPPARAARTVPLGAQPVAVGPTPAAAAGAAPIAAEAASSPGDDDPGPIPDAAGTAGGGRTSRAPTAAPQAPAAAASRRVIPAEAAGGADQPIPRRAAPVCVAAPPLACPLHPWEQP